MSDLKHRELKMQEKRKKTPWREFVKEICSWSQVLFYRIGDKISRYPDVKRIHSFCDTSSFEDIMTFPTNQHTYDDKKGFFSNFQTLWNAQSFPYLWQSGPGVENSAYSDTAYNCRNCYLSNVVCFDVQNVLYSYNVTGGCKDVFNSVFVSTNSEVVYLSSDVTNSQKVFFSKSINACYNTRFCTNLTGCQECIACHDLVNQSYCIENKQLTKEDYLSQKQQYINDILLNKKQYTIINQVTNSSLFQCTNVTNGLFSSYVVNGRNVCFVSRYGEGEKTNLYDVISSGGQIDSAYGCMGVSPGDNFYCCINCAFCSHVYYSYFLINCSYCLGCIGLKNKSFCIFNKQYEKDEWFRKVSEIFAKMDADGDLGKFFPGSMNPFYFNDTVAYLIDDTFTKEEVTKEGYLRRDEEIKIDIPEGLEIVESSRFESQKSGNKCLDDFQGFNDKGERYINPDILKKIIRDPKGNVYRIQKIEYDFLVKYGLPLPELHWLDRIKLGFKFKQNS